MHTVEQDKVDKERKFGSLGHRNLSHNIVQTREARSENGARKLPTEVDHISRISSNGRELFTGTLSENIFSDSSDKTKRVQKLNHQTKLHNVHLQTVFLILDVVQVPDHDAYPTPGGGIVEVALYHGCDW